MSTPLHEVLAAIAERKAQKATRVLLDAVQQPRGVDLPRLPAAVVSAIISFSTMTEWGRFAVTSRTMKSTADLPGSSPRSLYDPQLAADLPTPVLLDLTARHSGLAPTPFRPYAWKELGFSPAIQITDSKQLTQMAAVLAKDQGLESLCLAVNIRTLHSEPAIDGGGIAYYDSRPVDLGFLWRLTSLTKLDLLECVNGPLDHYAGIVNLPRLHTLSVKFTSVAPDDELVRLLPQLTNLRDLTVWSGRLPWSLIFRQLAEMTFLDRVDLTNIVAQVNYMPMGPVHTEMKKTWTQLTEHSKVRLLGSPEFLVHNEPLQLPPLQLQPHVPGKFQVFQEPPRRHCRCIPYVKNSTWFCAESKQPMNPPYAPVTDLNFDEWFFDDSMGH